MSVIDGSLEITTKMLSLLNPRMALENNGFVIGESCFKKGDIVFSYYPSHVNTVNINVWKNDVKISCIYKAEFINVLIVRDCVILTTPTCKVTINVD
jgi:hypothetical protein